LQPFEYISHFANRLSSLLNIQLTVSPFRDRISKL